MPRPEPAGAWSISSRRIGSTTIPRSAVACSPWRQAGSFPSFSQPGAGRASPMPRIEIAISRQSLTVLADDGRELERYSVSTSRNGAGEANGSFCTPRGEHIVRAKIGAGQPLNTVFRGRRPTGEIWTPELGESFPGRDWILTRILWLSGCEVGRNRLGEVDTMRRHIYIHGSPDPVEMGRPGSIGCIRMRNADIIELFDLVPPYTRVAIAA